MAAEAGIASLFGGGRETVISFVVRSSFEFELELEERHGEGGGGREMWTRVGFGRP